MRIFCRKYQMLLFAIHLYFRVRKDEYRKPQRTQLYLRATIRVVLAQTSIGTLNSRRLPSAISSGVSVVSSFICVPPHYLHVQFIGDKTAEFRDQVSPRYSQARKRLGIFMPDCAQRKCLGNDKCFFHRPSSEVSIFFCIGDRI